MFSLLYITSQSVLWRASVCLLFICRRLSLFCVNDDSEDVFNSDCQMSSFTELHSQLFYSLVQTIYKDTVKFRKIKLPLPTKEKKPGRLGTNFSKMSSMYKSPIPWCSVITLCKVIVIVYTYINKLYPTQECGFPLGW